MISVDSGYVMITVKDKSIVYDWVVVVVIRIFGYDYLFS